MLVCFCLFAECLLSRCLLFFCRGFLCFWRLYIGFLFLCFSYAFPFFFVSMLKSQSVHLHGALRLAEFFLYSLCFSFSLCLLCFCFESLLSSVDGLVWTDRVSLSWSRVVVPSEGLLWPFLTTTLSPVVESRLLTLLRNLVTD